MGSYQQPVYPESSTTKRETEASPELEDRFHGDDAQLVASIKALLDLDAAGSLVPHGLGGHARKLLVAAAVRLSCRPSLAEAAARAATAGPGLLTAEERERLKGRPFFFRVPGAKGSDYFDPATGLPLDPQPTAEELRAAAISEQAEEAARTLLPEGGNAEVTTLRDLFAMQPLTPGQFEAVQLAYTAKHPDHEPVSLATLLYFHADEMLAARAKEAK